MLLTCFFAARQLEFLAGRRFRGPNSFSLGDALGIAQHHDVVTGTTKQHTTNDYEKRLAIRGFEWEPDDILSEDLTYKKDETNTSISREQEEKQASLEVESWKEPQMLILTQNKLRPLRRSFNLENDEQKKNVIHTMLPRWKVELEHRALDASTALAKTQVDRVYVGSPHMVRVFDNEKRRTFLVRKEGLPDGKRAYFFTQPTLLVNKKLKRSDESFRDVSEDVEHIKLLVRNLSSRSLRERRFVLSDIRSLSKRITDNQILLAEAGAIPVLVILLTSKDSVTQEKAVTSILNLSIYKYNKGLTMLANVVPFIVQLLIVGTMETRENAAATLFSLSLANENKFIIGTSGAILALVYLLENGSTRGKKDAAIALFNLLGAVIPLMELAKNGSEKGSTEGEIFFGASAKGSTSSTLVLLEDLRFQVMVVSFVVGRKKWDIVPKEMMGYFDVFRARVLHRVFA
nr:U-box domain-containing protein 11 [Tanacetum cinerariifolium]